MNGIRALIRRGRRDARSVQPGRGSQQTPTVLTSGLQSCQKYTVVGKPPGLSYCVTGPRQLPAMGHGESGSLRLAGAGGWGMRRGSFPSVSSGSSLGARPPAHPPNRRSLCIRGGAVPEARRGRRASAPPRAVISIVLKAGDKRHLPAMLVASKP